MERPFVIVPSVPTIILLHDTGTSFLVEEATVCDVAVTFAVVLFDNVATSTIPVRIDGAVSVGTDGVGSITLCSTMISRRCCCCCNVSLSQCKGRTVSVRLVVIVGPFVITEDAGKGIVVVSAAMDVPGVAVIDSSIGKVSPSLFRNVVSGPSFRKLTMAGRNVMVSKNKSSSSLGSTRSYMDGW